MVARAAWRLRRRGWWWRPPFLPLPDEAYWHFRMVTATGEMTSRPSWTMVVDAARWSWHQARRR